MNWRWVDPATVYAVHDIQLKRHGGLDGVRDLNAVESAMNMAPVLHAYKDPAPDAADLAAAYIYGLATSHGFIDGNKRTAWVIGRLFLADNGIKLQFTDIEAINFMTEVASGIKTLKETAGWLRQRILP